MDRYPTQSLKKETEHCFLSCHSHPDNKIEWLNLAPFDYMADQLFLCGQCTIESDYNSSQILQIRLEEKGDDWDNKIFMNWPQDNISHYNEMMKAIKFEKKFVQISEPYILKINEFFKANRSKLNEQIDSLEIQIINDLQNSIKEGSFLNEYNKLCMKQQLKEIIFESSKSYEERTQLAKQVFQQVQKDQNSIRNQLKELIQDRNKDYKPDFTNSNKIMKSIFQLINKINFEKPTSNQKQASKKRQEGSTNNKESQENNNLMNIISVIKNPLNLLPNNYIDSLVNTLETHSYIFDEKELPKLNNSQLIGPLPNLSSEDVQNIVQLAKQLNERKLNPKIDQVKNIMEIVANPFNNLSKDLQLQIESNLKNCSFVINSLIDLPQIQVPSIDHLMEKDILDIKNIIFQFNKNREKKKQIHPKNHQKIDHLNFNRLIPQNSDRFKAQKLKMSVNTLKKSISSYINSFFVPLENIFGEQANQYFYLNEHFEELSDFNFSIQGSKMNDLGMNLIRRLLVKSKKLQSINISILDKTDISSKGIKSLFSGIKQVSKFKLLKKLQLEITQVLTIQDTKSLALMLSSCKGLELLQIKIKGDQSELREEAATDISESIGWLTNLSHLDLEFDFPIGNEGAEFLLVQIEKLDKLNFLRISLGQNSNITSKLVEENFKSFQNKYESSLKCEINISLSKLPNDQVENKSGEQNVATSQPTENLKTEQMCQNPSKQPTQELMETPQVSNKKTQQNQWKRILTGFFV